MDIKGILCNICASNDVIAGTNIAQNSFYIHKVAL